MSRSSCETWERAADVEPSSAPQTKILNRSFLQKTDSRPSRDGTDWEGTG
jgi:hypothetical protein